MGRSPFVFAALALAASLAACSASPDAGKEEESDPGLGEAAVSSLDPNASAAIAITEPEALRQLESRGFGFGHHVGAADLARADVLAATPTFGSIVKGIEKNLDDLQAADRGLDVGMRPN